MENINEIGEKAKKEGVDIKVKVYNDERRKGIALLVKENGFQNSFFCEPYKDVLRIRILDETVRIHNFIFLWEVIEEIGEELDMHFYNFDEEIRKSFEGLAYFNAKYCSPFTDLSRGEEYFWDHFSRVDFKYAQYIQYASIPIYKKKEIQNRFSFLIDFSEIVETIQQKHPTFSYSRISGDTQFSYLKSKLYYAGKEEECTFEKSEGSYLLKTETKQYRDKTLTKIMEDFLMGTKKEMRLQNLYKPATRYLEWMINRGNRFSEKQLLQIHEALKSHYDANEIEEKAAVFVRSAQQEFVAFKQNAFVSDTKEINVNIYSIFEKEILHMNTFHVQTREEIHQFFVGSREEIKQTYKELVLPEIENMVVEGF